MGKSSLYVFILSTLILAMLLANRAHAQAPSSSTSAPAASFSESSQPSTTTETSSQQGAVSAPKPVVLSFVEWKSVRVHEAQQKLEHAASSQIQNTQSITQNMNGATTPSDKSTGSEKSNEQKLNFNVDVALQLNIQDYFSMYLKSLSKEEFKEATKKLNTEEVSELLLAYKSSEEVTKGTALKFSKSEKR